MHQLSLFLLAALVCNTLASITFTGPDSSKKLNLSAPVTLTWTVDSENANTLLDIWFYGYDATGGTRFGYSLKENITATDLKWVWDPANVTDALLSTNSTLSSDKVFQFTGSQHANGTKASTTTQSDEYRIEGYPLIGNASTNAATRALFWAWGLLATSIAVQFGILG